MLEKKKKVDLIEKHLITATLLFNYSTKTTLEIF